MQEQTRTQVILAAVGMAGPSTGDLARWQANVLDNVGAVTAMLAPGSVYARRAEAVAGAKVFPATVLGITKEQSSTRGLVTLKTAPSQYNQDGTETARTDRTDTFEGLKMAQRIRALKGHRVMVWVTLEEFDSARGKSKVRVVTHVEDMGEDAEVMARIVAGHQQPA